MGDCDCLGDRTQRGLRRPAGVGRLDDTHDENTVVFSANRRGRRTRPDMDLDPHLLVVQRIGAHRF